MAGQCLAPPGPFVQLAAGDYHSCGLRADGSVACWGCGINGGSGVGNLDRCRPPDVTFEQIVAVDSTSCGLDLEGRLHCWGTYDELAVPQDGGFVQVDVTGSDSGCGLRDDGRVTCWGQVYEVVPDTPLTAMAIGSDFGCGLDDSGAVSCWGEKMETPPPAGQFVQISAAACRACAVSAEGEVACWGDSFGWGQDGPEGGGQCL